MNKEKILIPDLRFPEFKTEGNWEEKKISDLGEIINGLAGKSGEDFGTGKPFVTYKQVFANSIIDFEKCGKVQINENEKQNALQKGDILFTTSSETPNEVGFASVLVNSPKEETYLNSFCFALRPFSLEETRPQFARYLFHSPAYRNGITTLAQGSTRYNISKGAFLNLKLLVPKSQEQQKIASCLTSLDEVITGYNQKLELLKLHKKGLMQNLFPQEGETVPKYRFPEFINDGEWLNGQISDLVNTLMGNAFRSDDFEKNGIQLVRMGNLYQGHLQLNRTPAFLPVKFAEEYSKFLIKPSDILMSMTGTIGKRDYGFVIQTPNDCPKLLLNQRVLKIIPKKNCVKEFILQLMKDDFFLEKLYSLPGGTKQANLSVSQLNSIAVLFPSVKEQKKIASCLSSLDELITALVKKTEQLKQQKKGLMQGLFSKKND